MTRPATCAGGSGISNQRVQNLHNAMGQRAVKSVDGGTAGTIHFIYDQAGQVIAEIDAATGMTLREYIYVNGVQVALVDDTGTQDEAVYFVHTDHLATPQKITDSAQAVVWSGSYEPFGEVEETVNLVENNIRFPGQYEDGETGLHYNYFRDYDPSLGRYVESDPIGLVYTDSISELFLFSEMNIGHAALNHLYTYSHNSPSRYFDDGGLFPKKYTKGPNPNKATPEHRKRSKGGFRERNRGIDEEHSTRPKGNRGIRGRKGAGFVLPGLLGRVIGALGFALTPQKIGCAEIDCDGDGVHDRTGQPIFDTGNDCYF